MKFACIHAEEARYAVSVMCRLLEVSRSGYYAWRGREPSKRALEDEVLVEHVRKAHKAGRGYYGSPRIHRELRGRGIRMSRKRVARLMRLKGIVGRRRRSFRKTTDSKHTDPISPNLLERDFTAEEPNKVWVTDITYIRTHEGWLYLSAILDLYSRFVVGWSMSDCIDTKLCLGALGMAVKARNPPPGLIHHSDRGCQYASSEYRQALSAEGLVGSMSRRGDCWDNAPAESFWSTLKTELIDDRIYDTRAEARQAIFEYIEVFYNRQRRHSSIDYLTPVEQEARYQDQVRLAG